MNSFRGILTNALVAILLITFGWFARGWLAANANDWPSVRFTLQAVIPVLAAAIYFAVNEGIVRITWARIVINIVVIGGLLAWFNNLVYPADYVWSDALPVIGGVLVALIVAVTGLSWIKPHLADWPWWGAFRRQQP